MAGLTTCRFLSLLLALYLATTAFFLLFIQHTSERHLLTSHSARSPLLVRRSQALRSAPPPPPPPMPLLQELPPPPARLESGLGKAEIKRRAAGARGARSDGTSEGRESRAEAKEVKKAAMETDKKTSGARRPLILFWTPLWGRLENWSRFFSVPRLGQCRARCSFTSQEDRLPEASLVLFSAADLQQMPPPVEAGRLERSPGQLWALFAPDPPPADSRLEPNQVDGLFNWTVSYRSDADVPLQYGRTVPLTKRDQRAAAAAARRSTDRSALFRPQQCHTPSRREDYIRELGQHMTVHVLGPCGNDSCGTAPQCLDTHAGNHTFYLALEAAHCADFVSARLHQALRHGLVPVVRGGADYSRLAPPDSYIDAAPFSDPAALARYLRSLSDAQLRGHHRWRTTHRVLPASWACDLCTRLHALAATGKRMPAYGGDRLVRWWEQGRCRVRSEATPAG